MAVPVWIANQVLTASDVNNWFVPIANWKAADETRTTLTPAIDSGVSFSVAANAVYVVTAGIGYSCASGGITWNFVQPTGCAGNCEVAGQLGGPAAARTTWIAGATGSSSTTGAFIIAGILAVGSTPGAFAFNWASNSGPAALTVNAYSYLKAVRVG